MRPIWRSRDKPRWLRRRLNHAGLDLAWRLGLVRVPGLPRVVMVEPTNLCNLRCPLCPAGAGTLRRPPALLGFDLYLRLLAELDGSMERLLLYNYGEPFLHPRLFDMIAEARRAEVHTRVSTNGLVFDRAQAADDLIACGLDYLRVSVDGATQETYAMYRVGGCLDRVLEGVRLLQERKRALSRRRPVVELQFIVFRHNEHEVPSMRRLAHELGVLLRLKSAGLGDLAEAPGRQRWLPLDPSLRRDQAAVGGPGAICEHPWSRLVVNCDGWVVPCCYDPRGEHRLGHASQGLGAIWNGPQMLAFRRALRSGTPPAICRRCSGHLWGNPRFARLERP